MAALNGAAILQIGRDPRRAKAIIADLVAMLAAAARRVIIWYASACASGVSYNAFDLRLMVQKNDDFGLAASPITSKVGVRRLDVVARHSMPLAALVRDADRVSSASLEATSALTRRHRSHERPLWGVAAETR
ncbi:hypothetical protein BQ8794_320039 [Mesorhizobium prunaredense]|uniref:Uncharacterized protein n=1 Tax=Mesorhizobium prunaredense TaxID=1631249 RepID=A0A1R3VBB4_9HYPH|nr:hypothetical protein [Mesorhizobium prunaredense]SIT57217.1 hypothetical protein BQ8794_320039 [Mesorhizobium prunaredense]